MRTTIEMNNRHRAALLKMAGERGEKGFSKLVEEALQEYLENSRRKKSMTNAALSIFGTFSGKGAEKLEKNYRFLRKSWR